ncbi:neugrin domain-containing protein [Ceratobasidium sp. AG-Ba]|nr:neugrin domain-containing protein [Ceratobasidium sp. AG-Ba]
MQTRAIYWGPRFSREPVSTPRTIQKNTLYRPIVPDPDDSRRATPLVRKGSRSRNPQEYPPRPARRPTPTLPEYKAHRARMKQLYPEGWGPSHTISREAMETLREMYARDPVQFRTPVLANKFKISPEAVSRILKSKWQPSPERKAEMVARDRREKDRLFTERMRVEREETKKSFKGRPALLEPDRGKES